MVTVAWCLACAGPPEGASGDPPEPKAPAWDVKTEEDRVYGTPKITATLVATEGYDNLVGLEVTPTLRITCAQGRTSMVIETMSALELELLQLVTLPDGRQTASVPIAVRIGDSPPHEGRGGVVDLNQLHLVDKPVTLLWRMRDADRMVVQWPPTMREPVQIGWRWSDTPFVEAMDEACDWQIERLFDAAGFSLEQRAQDREKMQKERSSGAPGVDGFRRVLREMTEDEVLALATASGSGDQAGATKATERAVARLNAECAADGKPAECWK